MSTEIIRLIKQSLLKCIEDGVKSYKELMESILATKQPLKDSQLRQFHTKNSEVIITALESSYEGIKAISSTTTDEVNIHHEINQLLTKAKTRLNTLINKQFNEIYLRKNDIQMHKAVKKVKEYTLEAEMLYDEKQGQFQVRDKSFDDLKKAHHEWTEEAIQLFLTLLKNNEYDLEDFWKCELESKLNERWDDILQEFIELNPDFPASSLTEALKKMEIEVHENSAAAAKRQIDHSSESLPSKLIKLQLGESESERSTATHESIEDDTLIAFVRQSIFQCVEVGVKNYTDLMDALLLPKQPLKDSQLRDYHSKTSQTLKNLLGATYDEITAIADRTTVATIQELLAEETKRLETLIDKKFNDIYLRKNEIQMDDVMKQVKGFTSQAEMLYDEKCDGFQLQGKSRHDVVQEHEKWVEEAMQLFAKLLKENHFKSEEFWKYELKLILQERLNDLLEEIPAAAVPAGIPMEQDHSEAPDNHVEEQQIQVLLQIQQSQQAAVAPTRKSERQKSTLQLQSLQSSSSGSRRRTDEEKSATSQMEWTAPSNSQATTSVRKPRAATSKRRRAGKPASKRRGR